MTSRALEHAGTAGAAWDPLTEAGAWIRKALAVPYEASDSAAWVREFQACVAAMRRVLAARGIALRSEASRQPRLQALASREADAHEQVTRIADDLFTDAYLAVQPDLLEMVDLVESAKELERALDRLRDHRSDVLFEETHRDIGGGG